MKKLVRVQKNRYTTRKCAACGLLIGHLRLMASVGGKPWTCMPCEWQRRDQLKRLMETPPRPSQRNDTKETETA